MILYSANSPVNEISVHAHDSGTISIGQTMVDVDKGTCVSMGAQLNVMSAIRLARELTAAVTAILDERDFRSSGMTIEVAE